MNRYGFPVGLITLILLIINSNSSNSQPYFDPAGFTGWMVPQNGSTNTESELYGIAFLSIPSKIGKNQRLILSPFYENRTLNRSDQAPNIRLQGICLPITLVKYTADTTWTIQATFLTRINGSELSLNSEFWQFGGVLLNTVRVRENLKLKFGLYYNKEFFGHFFIPLAGIEWEINSRMNLFGAFPSQMKLEYKLSKSIYTGINFKSITNSYRYTTSYEYIKVVDNHLGLYADFNLPGKLVFMVEAGHTIFREIGGKSTSYSGFNKDFFIFKTGLYYRIRFDKN